MQKYKSDRLLELEYSLRNNEINEKREELRRNRDKYESKQYIRECNDLYNMVNNRIDNRPAYSQFIQETRDMFVIESILAITNSCLNSVVLKDDYNKALSRQLVTNFVKEEGSSNLLNRFKRTSNLLSEIAYICQEHVQMVIENSDRNNKDTMKIDQNTKKSFFSKLDKVDSDRAISEIRNRVMDSTQNFIDSNTMDKMKIKDILQDTKEKIDASANKKNKKELQESYIYNSKRAIQEIRNNKVQNVFEAMVYSLARSSMVNESANEMYVENNALNMDKIVEHCEIMYNFLTTIDTVKIKDVNESYIQKVLKELKS